MPWLNKFLPAGIAGHLSLRNVFGGKAASALPLFLAPAMLIWGLYAAGHQAEVLDGLQLQLRTINSLKADQLRTWLEDHARESTRLSGHPVFGGVLAEEIAKPGSRRKALDTWLKQHLINNEYVSLAFLTPSGRQIAATPDYQPANEQFFRDSFDASVKACRGRLTDIYASVSGRPRLAMLIPMSRTGTCAGGTVGVLVVNIDPEVKLFPILKDDTARLAGIRMHLARRENGDAVILNTGAAFLRMPLADADLSVSAALQGRTGFREGLGEDGLKVYALAEQITGSSWTLVTEMTKGEALRQSRTSEYLALVGLLFLATLVHGLFAAVLRAKEALAEAQLRDGEKRMAALLSTLPGCAYRCLNDPDWTPVFISPGFEDITGYPPEEFMAKKLSFGAMIVPEDRERVWKSVQESVARDGRVSVTYTIKTRDGIRRTVFSQAVVARDAGGNKIAFDGYLSDITPLKKAEEALRISEARFRETVELAVDGILMGSDKGVIIGANTQMEKLSGRPRSELLNHHVGELFDPAEMKANPLRFDLLNAGQQLVIERNLLRPDGSRLLVEMHSKRMPDGSYQTFYRDISERKRAEEALRGSEAQFRGLFEATRDALMLLEGPDWTFTSGNEAVKEVFGAWELNDLIGRHPWECSPERQPDGELSEVKARRMVEAALREGSHLFEWEHKRGDGSNFPAEVLLTRVDLAGRELLVANVRDITQRKKAELELKRSEEKFRTLIEKSSIGIFIMKGRLIDYANPALERMFGYGLGEVAGKFGPEKFVHPDELQLLLKLMTQRLDGIPQAEVRTWRGVKKDGSRIIMELSSMPVDFEGVRAIMGTVVDVTSRERAQEELRESEARYRAIFTGAGEGMLVADEAGRKFRYANKAICEMFGYTEEELLKLSVAEIHPAESLAEVAAAFDAQRRGLMGATEMPCKKKNGEVFYASIIGKTVHIDGGDYVLGFFSDVTERRKAEEEARKLTASLAEKTREMENVLYITTHDLRGPLVNVQGFSGNLGKHFEALKGALKADPGPAAEQALEKVPEALNFINESAMRMDNLIRALLKVSRLGRTEMKREALDMDRIVGKVIDSMRFRLLEGGGEIKAGPLPRCHADPSAMDQVIGNLLDNALKYRSKERPLEVRIGGEVRGGAVVYSVADNGVGIAAGDLPRIWDIFFRVRGSGAHGEGIGLTMTKTLVEKNGGRMRVESEEGKGTTFYVELPPERRG